jgi:hypothetical protein
MLDREMWIHFMSITKLKTLGLGQNHGLTTRHRAIALTDYQFMLKVAGHEVVEQLVQPRVHELQKHIVIIAPIKNLFFCSTHSENMQGGELVLS